MKKHSELGKQTAGGSSFFSGNKVVAPPLPTQTMPAEWWVPNQTRQAAPRRPVRARVREGRSGEEDMGWEGKEENPVLVYRGSLSKHLSGADYLHGLNNLIIKRNIAGSHPGGVSDTSSSQEHDPTSYWIQTTCKKRIISTSVSVSGRKVSTCKCDVKPAKIKESLLDFTL